MNLLFHIKHQSFKILTLWMVDVDGMVGRLRELMQDAHLAPRHGRRAEYRKAELLLRHRLRAGKREENASRTNLLKCLHIEFAIAYEGIFQRALMLCKCWRIENYKVITVIDSAKKLECILRKCLVTAVAWEIKLDIGIRQTHSLFRTVDRMHCASLRHASHRTKILLCSRTC